MNKHDLKELLYQIRDNDYAVLQDINHYELSLEMMNFIGDIDSDLRDELILTTFYHWILKGRLSNKEVSRLLEITMDENHLFNGLGRTDDSVFCRTFSSELLAYIIYRHRMESFITETNIHNTFHLFLKYYIEENDVRGYVEHKGWAHGVAHGADVLDEFARCKEIGYEELHMILDAIYKKVNIYHYGYIHFEDERMITSIKALLDRKIIPMDEIILWINSFHPIEKSGKYPEDLVFEFNVNLFFKSLYFRLVDIPEYEQLTHRIKCILKETNRYDNT